MATDRRTVLRALGGGAAAVAASSVVGLSAFASQVRPAIYLNAQGRPGGDWRAGAFDADGRLLLDEKLPGRGHGFALDPISRQAVVFSRRPGTFAVVLDLSAAKSAVTFHTPADRHFYGHGVFSPGGDLLYATENDFDNAQSVVGIFDVAGGFVRIGEFPTHGIGAHEMLLTRDGTTLVVANGGIETHPDFGRAELNLATMDPSLTFLDARTGDLIGQLRLSSDLHQLSMRHLAFDAAGRVWFGCQFRGAPDNRPQLVGTATRDGEIRLLELPETTLLGLRNYIGSVAASRDGDRIAISSPQGNAIVILDATSGAPLMTDVLDNGCGLIADGAGFIASSGDGAWQPLGGSPAEARRFNFRFDNHLAARL